METKPIAFTRRAFLGQAAVMVAGGLLLTESQAAALPPVKESDPLAKALMYSNKAPAGKPMCNTCGLYTGKSGDKTGPCALFPGKSVAAEGWCKSYVKKL